MRDRLRPALDRPRRAPVERGPRQRAWRRPGLGDCGSGSDRYDSDNGSDCGGYADVEAALAPDRSMVSHVAGAKAGDLGVSLSVTVVEGARLLLSQSALERHGYGFTTSQARYVMWVPTPEGRSYYDLERNVEGDLLLPHVMICDEPGPKLMVVPSAADGKYKG